MGRKITMTGSNARYIEHRGYDAVPDEDREILMEGDEAEYQEHSYGTSESIAQKRTEYGLTELTSGVEKVRPFFWSDSSMAFIFCNLEVLRITYSSNRMEMTTIMPSFQLKSIIRQQLMTGMKNAATEGRANSRNRMVLALLV